MPTANYESKSWPEKRFKRSPLHDLTDRLGANAFPQWADHQYVGKSEDGRTIYVCCPYQLSGEAVRDLAHLESCGWHVLIHAHAEYGNGTVQVELYKKTDD